MDNPWQVDSIEEFSYLKCPECTYDTKEKSIFKYHAIENHPLSRVLFETTELDNSAIEETDMYDPNDIEKCIDEHYTELEGEYQNFRLGEYIKLGIVQKVYE